MDKTIKKIMAIAARDPQNHPIYFWEKPLKDNCEKLIWFDVRKNYLDNGKTKTRKSLVELFRLEKPEFVFLFDSLFYDLDILELIIMFREISPDTKILFFEGDDDIRFQFTKYLALFLDCILTAQSEFVEKYRKDGNNAILFMLLPEQIFPPIKNKKEYDVSFIGTAKANREEILKCLYKAGIDLTIFGPSWNKSSGLKIAHDGFLSPADYLRTIDKTKISLELTKNGAGIPSFKSRFLEISLRMGFCIVEYSPIFAKMFEEGKEIIFFRTEQDLLEKIEYYLDHDKEREKIAKAAYKKIMSKYNFEEILRNLLRSDLKSSILPKLDYSMLNINEQFFKLPQEEILRKVKNYDYISFSKGKTIKSPYKDYLQIYSIKSSKRAISCCDYTIYSKSLGDYARFEYTSLNNMYKKQNLSSLLTINQIVLTKDFFIEHFSEIKEAYKTDNINFVNDKNTEFVSLPLVKLSKFRRKFFKNIEFKKEIGVFSFSFPREFFSRRRKPFQLLSYTLSLIKEAISGKRFIIIQLKNKFNILKSLKS
jgi:Glycosyl transferases group 1